MVIPLDKRPCSGPYSGLTARSARRFLTQSFRQAGLNFAEEDALEIVLSATGLDKTGFMLRGREDLHSHVIDIIKQHMERRLSGEPVDHILGWREFFGRRFIVNSDVLSPRADTETLVRGALARLVNTESPKILDLGTGSGAIGLTLLAERPDAVLTATDMSAAALSVAAKNARLQALEDRVQFLRGSWWEAIPAGAKFDMIVSNPPYISNDAMETLETEVISYDPDLALRGGPEGLDAYRAITSGAKNFLTANGWLGFEIGFDQGAALRDLLSNAPWTHTCVEEVCVEQDLSGLDRVVWARRHV